jgi:hypothetical protein
MKVFSLFSGKEEDNTQKTSAYLQNEEGELSYRLLERYNTSSRANWLEDFASSSNFRAGYQWTQDEEAELKEEGLPPVVVNVIHPSVDQIKAAMTANNPQFSVTGAEGSDHKVASIFSDVLSDIWRSCDGKSQTRQMIDDYIIGGNGIYLAYVDPTGENGQSKVKFAAIDPRDVWVDPDTKDYLYRDAAHILIGKILTSEQLQHYYSQYAEAFPKMEECHTNSLSSLGGEVRTDDPQLPATDPEAVKYCVIDRYSRIKHVVHIVRNPVDGSEWEMNAEQFQTFLGSKFLYEITANSLPQLITDSVKLREAMGYVEKFGNTFHYAIDPNDRMGKPLIVPGEENPELDSQQGMQTIPGSTVRLNPVPVAELIKKRVLDYEEFGDNRIKRVFSIGRFALYTEIMPVEDHVIVPCINGFGRSPHGRSDVKIVRPLQVYINKLRALILVHAANSAGVKLAIQRGSADVNELRKQWRRAGTAVIEVDMELGAPVQVAPPPLPNELYLDEARMRSDIQEILGTYTLSAGNPDEAPTTYKGTVAIDEYGQRRIKNKKDEVEATLTQLAYILIRLIQANYTEPRIIRLIRPNNTTYSARVNYLEDQSAFAPKINDLSVGRYDVIVVSGSMLPVNRWARFEYYMALYEKGVIDRLELLKHAEIVDPQAVAERMSEIEILRQQLNTAIDKIKDLEGDLQTATRESMHDRKRVEVEKFKSSISGLRQKAEAATEIYTKRLADEVALAATSVKEDGKE